MEAKFKSYWENKVANALDKEDIAYEYEPGFLPIIDKIRYTPDFLLEKEVAGKRIILEPHGPMEPLHFIKFALFRKVHGGRFFLILLVRNDAIPLIPKNAYDDIWPIEFPDLLVRKLKDCSPS
jgi:hypothetical protein